MGQQLVELVRNKEKELCIKGREDLPIPPEGLRAVGDPFSVKDPFNVKEVFDFIEGAIDMAEISSANAYRHGRICNGEIAVQLYEITEELLVIRGCGHDSSYG